MLGPLLLLLTMPLLLLLARCCCQAIAAMLLRGTLRVWLISRGVPCATRRPTPILTHAYHALGAAQHYMVVTIKKASLVSRGALRADLASAELLTKDNLDVPKLMELSREIATIIGLPESTQFCDFHPAKLFDFSSRARCVAPFRVLGIKPGGARAGSIVSADLEVHPYLSAEESKYLQRTLGTFRMPQARAPPVSNCAASTAAHEHLR